MQEKYKQRHSLSTWEYLVSASSNLLLTKYIALSFPSNSWIRADPIARSAADKCNLNDLSFWGGTYTGGDTKYYFIFPRASCCFFPQTNSWSALSFNNGLKGCTFPDRFDINLRIKLILPIKDWSSVLFIGATTCLIVVMLFCPTSMPLSWTMKPRNCPGDTPKAYLHWKIMSRELVPR